MNSLPALGRAMRQWIHCESIATIERIRGGAGSPGAEASGYWLSVDYAGDTGECVGTPYDQAQILATSARLST